MSKYIGILIYISIGIAFYFASQAECICKYGVAIFYTFIIQFIWFLFSIEISDNWMKFHTSIFIFFKGLLKTLFSIQ